MLDSSTCTLSVFGETIEWDAMSDEVGDTQYIQLQKTLDLNREFSEIAKQLDQIVYDHFGTMFSSEVDL